MGFKTAIDDFGAGYAGLGLLTKFQPDFVKLDMDLVRDVHRDPVKQRIVEGMFSLLSDLGIGTVCEGVETMDDLEALRGIGVRYFQGYALARPQFEGLVPLSAVTPLGDARTWGHGPRAAEGCS